MQDVQTTELLKYPSAQVVQTVVELYPIAHEEQSFPVKPVAQVAQIVLLLQTWQFGLITVQGAHVPFTSK